MREARAVGGNVGVVRPKCKWTVLKVLVHGAKRCVNFWGVCAGPSRMNRRSSEGSMFAKLIYNAGRCQYILVTRL